MITSPAHHETFNGKLIILVHSSTQFIDIQAEILLIDDFLQLTYSLKDYFNSRFASEQITTCKVGGRLKQSQNCYCFFGHTSLDLGT